MDSRERVLASISHQRPDRVPCDLWAEPGVWERLKKDLGVSCEEDVRKALAVDIRYVSPIYPPDTITNGVKQNMWGERWEKTSTVYGLEWEHTRGVLFEAQTLADLEAFPWPTCDQVDYSRVREDVRRYEGHAIFYGNADFFERPGLVRGPREHPGGRDDQPGHGGLPAGAVRIFLHRGLPSDDGGVREERSTCSGPSRTWAPRSGSSWGGTRWTATSSSR